MSSLALPSNWTTAEVHELFEIVGGGTPSTAIPEYWIGDVPWITSADIDENHHITPRKCISADAIQNSATNKVPIGSIIVVTRVGLGKVGIAPTDLCFSQDSQALLFNKACFDPQYVLLFMGQAVAVFKHISRGTTISGVTKKQLATLKFLLPPLKEQQRIVAEIEKQFTRLDAAVKALKRVQANLKRYRATVLKSAFEGRLVPAESMRPMQVNEILHEPLANGRSPRQSSSGVLILKLTALRDGEIDLEENRLGEVPSGIAAQLQIKKNDIFVSRGNGSVHLVGKAGLVKDAPDCRLIFPDTMIRIRLIQSVVIPRYFVYVWNSRVMRSQIERTARTTAGIHKISQTDIERFVIPIPSAEVQQGIIDILDQQLSSAMKLEAQILVHLIRADRLRQSILKRAFEGKLVPQDPNDEPALKVLERLRMQDDSRTKFKSRHTKYQSGRKPAILNRREVRDEIED